MIFKFAGYVVLAVIFAPLSFIYFDYPYAQYVEYISLFLYGIMAVGETINFISSRKSEEFAVTILTYNRQNCSGMFFIGFVMTLVSLSALTHDYILLGLASAYIVFIASLNHSLIHSLIQRQSFNTPTNQDQE